MQSIIATQDNAIIIQEDNQFGTIYRLIENGTLFTCVKDTSTNRWVPLREVILEPKCSRWDTIEMFISPNLMLEVYASGGEMGYGCLDNNLTYFLDPNDAVENLKYHWQNADFEASVTGHYRNKANFIEDETLNWDYVRENITATGTVFEDSGYKYHICETSIRLIDYLLMEME